MVAAISGGTAQTIGNSQVEAPESQKISTRLSSYIIRRCCLRLDSYTLLVLNREHCTAMSAVVSFLDRVCSPSKDDSAFHTICFLSLRPWKFLPSSMETSTNFHGSKSTSMEGSTNFHGSKFTSKEISMEVSSNFHGSKSTSIEISMEVSSNFHGSKSTSMEVDRKEIGRALWRSCGNFHGSRIYSSTDFHGSKLTSMEADRTEVGGPF